MLGIALILLTTMHYSKKAAIKKIIDEFDVDKLTRVLELQAELKTLIQDEIWMMICLWKFLLRWI